MEWWGRGELDLKMNKGEQGRVGRVGSKNELYRWPHIQLEHDEHDRLRDNIASNSAKINANINLSCSGI